MLEAERTRRTTPAGREPPAASGVDFFERYLTSASEATRRVDLRGVHELAVALREAWSEGRQVFLCGNGGSAANAIHLANDLLYGVASAPGQGLRVHALAANAAVLTCLANDLAYDAIFATQIEVLGRKGDLLLALSGSGNSGNIVSALRAARRCEMSSFAILGFSGGASLALADHSIHLPVHDMQMAEDFQLVVGHMVMQWLKANPPTA